jgi:hypothetical protein
MRRSLLLTLLILMAAAVAGAVAYAASGSDPTLTAPQATAIVERSAEVSAIADTRSVGGTLSVSYGTNALSGLTTVALTTIPRGAKLGRAGGFVMDLEPGTTYHYRLMLTTIDGTATTPDATFTTAGRTRAARCRVPALTGRTWPVAHRALLQANCRTGTVRRPVRTARPRTLVVVSQTIAAGRVRAAGTRVGVRLQVRR